MSKKAKILIVDDEPEIVEVLNLFLENAFDTVTFIDSRRASEEIGRTFFDLVISDIKMPHLNGLELLRHIKATSPRTCVVLMTGHAQTEQDRNHATKLGASGILFKPFGDPEDVISYFQDAIAKNGIASENTTGQNFNHKSGPAGSPLTFPEPLVVQTRKRVLVLDDEQDLLEIIESILSGTLEVELYRSPILAITAAKEGRFDCILTDLSMPEMAAQAVILGFKEAAPTTPIVVMSGHSFEDREVSSALKNGASSAIQKPFQNMSEVLDVVSRCAK